MLKFKEIKTFKTYVTETFDTKLKWKESVTKSGDQNIHEFIATIDGSEIKLTIDDEPGVVAEIYFERDGRMDVTEQGKAAKVFGGVLNKLLEWLKAQDKKPKQIYFTAQDFNKSTSREGLYDKMVNRYAGKLGYTSRKFKANSMNHSFYYLDLKKK